jgi:hypothetical protein
LAWHWPLFHPVPIGQWPAAESSGRNEHGRPNNEELACSHHRTLAGGGGGGLRLWPTAAGMCRPGRTNLPSPSPNSLAAVRPLALDILSPPVGWPLFRWMDRKFDDMAQIWIWDDMTLGSAGWLTGHLGSQFDGQNKAITILRISSLHSSFQPNLRIFTPCHSIFPHSVHVKRAAQLPAPIMLAHFFLSFSRRR